MIEASLSTILRLGRAMGIHAFLSTQRPSRDVIPGVVVNNSDVKICGRADNVLSEIVLDKVDAAEQSELLEALKYGTIRYYEIMLISMFTGMRGGEICAPNVEDINFRRKTIVVSKTVARNKNKVAIINDNTKTKAGTRVLHINDDMVAFLKKLLIRKQAEDYSVQVLGKY